MSSVALQGPVGMLRRHSGAMLGGPYREGFVPIYKGEGKGVLGRADWACC